MAGVICKICERAVSSVMMIDEELCPRCRQYLPLAEKLLEYQREHARDDKRLSHFKEADEMHEQDYDATVLGSAGGNPHGLYIVSENSGVHYPIAEDGSLDAPCACNECRAGQRGELDRPYGQGHFLCCGCPDELLWAEEQDLVGAIFTDNRWTWYVHREACDD